jgi:hypothetical protein
MQGNGPGLIADNPVLHHAAPGQDQMPQPRRVRRRRMVGPRRPRPYVGAHVLGYYGSDGQLVCPGHVGIGMSQKMLRSSRAILSMSHKPMISLHSSAEFIAALASLARGPWISSSRFGDKWSRHASTGSSRALPSLAEDHCRWRLPAPTRVGEADVTPNDDAVAHLWDQLDCRKGGWSEFQSRLQAAEIPSKCRVRQRFRGGGPCS